MLTTRSTAPLLTATITCILAAFSPHAQAFQSSSWKCFLNSKPTPACQEPNGPKVTVRVWDVSNGNCHDERPLLNGHLVCKEAAKTVWEGDFKSGNYHGVIKDYRSDGTVYHTTFVSGVENGPYKEFDAKGRLKEEKTNVNGQQKGIQKSYHENGKLARAWTMQATVEYAVDGKLTHLTCAQPVAAPEMTRLCGYDGKESEVKLHDGKGKVKETRVYLSGVEKTSKTTGNGNASVVFEQKDGLSVRTEKYPNGKTRGVAKAKGTQMVSEVLYFKNGKIEAEREWQGEKIAKERTYYQNGQLKEDKTRKGGAKGTTVEAKEFFDDGKKKNEGVFLEETSNYGSKHSRQWNGSFAYDNDWGYLKPDGKIVEYYQNGELAMEANYRKGKLEGKSKAFYDDGESRSEESYKDGKLVRRVTYDEDGEVKINEEYYEDGSRKSTGKATGKKKKKSKKAH